ncbi:lipoprotein [Roseibium polysiphoniae]|uniref:Lipoprotein n=1 Tax=Roseibium polysiphoniae TaxID=2571221 RepID=A0ABR9CCB2_9HYPH|nr:lipoprotein [Roseibium polysiphoniae]MBD8877533.1 hypothetical protein [Roseibium polysiphoniae]
MAAKRFVNPVVLCSLFLALAFVVSGCGRRGALESPAAADPASAAVEESGAYLNPPGAGSAVERPGEPSSAVPSGFILDALI